MSYNREEGVSHLFLVRLRAEESRELKQPESKRWFGHVQRVVSGEAYEFCGWAELIKCLGMMVDDPQAVNDAEEYTS